MSSEHACAATPMDRGLRARSALDRSIVSFPTMTALRRVTLPNNIEVWAANRFEAEALYVEIVEERTYQSHGIDIPDNAVVFDVGANLGLFSVHLARTVPGVRIHAFEPIPVMFEALRNNLAMHAPLACAHNLGLSKHAGEAVFEFDRFTTMAATMHPGVFAQGARERVSLRAFVSAGLTDLHKIRPRSWTRVAERALAMPLLRVVALTVLAPAAVALEVRRRLFLKQQTCRLETLSNMLAASGVSRVDLVKIDVEGAEEDVLGGVEDADWPRLRQFVIEVHDVNGRLERMTALLQRHGYRTISERPDWAVHRLLGIWTLYAVRDAGTDA